MIPLTTYRAKDPGAWRIMGFGSSHIVFQLIPAGTTSVNIPRAKAARITVCMMANDTSPRVRGQWGYLVWQRCPFSLRSSAFHAATRSATSRADPGTPNSNRASQKAQGSLSSLTISCRVQAPGEHAGNGHRNYRSRVERAGTAGGSVILCLSVFPRACDTVPACRICHAPNGFSFLRPSQPQLRY